LIGDIYYAATQLISLRVRGAVASHRINYAGALIEFRRHVVDQAYAAFRKVVEEEGMKAFAAQPKASNVIPFPRRH
jgi:hypothetical protein